jgi:hypothetical protein
MTTDDMELEVLALKFMARDAIARENADEANAYVDTLNHIERMIKKEKENQCSAENF